MLRVSQHHQGISNKCPIYQGLLDGLLQLRLLRLIQHGQLLLELSPVDVLFQVRWRGQQVLGSWCKRTKASRRAASGRGSCRSRSSRSSNDWARSMMSTAGCSGAGSSGAGSCCSSSELSDEMMIGSLRSGSCCLGTHWTRCGTGRPKNNLISLSKVSDARLLRLRRRRLRCSRLFPSRMGLYSLMLSSAKCYVVRR